MPGSCPVWVSVLISLSDWLCYRTISQNQSFLPHVAFGPGVLSLRHLTRVWPWPSFCSSPNTVLCSSVYTSQGSLTREENIKGAGRSINIVFLLKTLQTCAETSGLDIQGLYVYNLTGISCLEKWSIVIYRHLPLLASVTHVTMFWIAWSGYEVERSVRSPQHFLFSSSYLCNSWEGWEISKKEQWMGMPVSLHSGRLASFLPRIPVFQLSVGWGDEN